MTELWSVEQAWERLQRHIEWADRFWLVFVFTDDPRVADLLRDRVRSELGLRGQSLVEFRPPTADKDSVRGMLEELVEGRPDSVAWVDLVRHDEPQSTAWRDAWQYTCMQLNQRREVLRRQWATGGIVLSTTLDRLDATPGLAPDLWTIRALLLRLASLPAERDAAMVIVQEPLGSLRYEPVRDPELARQAVDRARRMLEATPSDAALVNLARALDAYGTTLDSWGRREEALFASLEAIDILRSVGRENPDAFVPDLAWALANLGVRLGSLGQREEAMAATRDAVQQFRKLAQERPDAFLPYLAQVLSNLGVRLGSLGQWEEAATATREAVQLYRTLSESPDPDSLHGLARALSNLGNDLNSLGQREKAVEASLEAVQLYRTLAEANPDAFLPDLARGLNNLGNHLTSLGQRDKAMAAAHEAVQHYRTLAEASPDSFLPELALVLNNLAVDLSSLGQHLTARDHCAEGLRFILPYFVKLPAAYVKLTTNLARQLRQIQDEHGVPIPEPLAPAVALILDQTANEPPTWSQADLDRLSQLLPSPATENR